MNNPEVIPTEDTPLSSEELDRVESLALHLVARGFDRECHVCALEAPLIVRLAYEARESRKRIEDFEMADIDR